MKSRLLLVVLAHVALWALAPAAAAQTNIYHIRGNASAGSNNIWAINPTSGAQTLVYTGYPGGNAATLAQRPSDGMLFYAINNSSGSNGAVYRFTPATPGVAPVLLGTLGAGVGSGFRMAFLGNTLYYISGGAGADNDRLYSVNTTTGQATAGPNITGTGNGGDMAFLGNTLYIINQNRQLYTARPRAARPRSSAPSPSPAASRPARSASPRTPRAASSSRRRTRATSIASRCPRSTPRSSPPRAAAPPRPATWRAPTSPRPTSPSPSRTA